MWLKDENRMAALTTWHVSFPFICTPSGRWWNWEREGTEGWGENTGISPLPPAEACHHKHRTGVSSHLLPVCSLLPQPNSTGPTGMPNWLVFHAWWPTTGLSVFCTVPRRCPVGSTQWWLPCREDVNNIQCICKYMSSFPKPSKLSHWCLYVIDEWFVVQNQCVIQIALLSSEAHFLVYPKSSFPAIWHYVLWNEAITFFS